MSAEFDSLDVIEKAAVVALFRSFVMPVPPSGSVSVLTLSFYHTVLWL